MSFISYAQNFEDVLLWRALKDVQNGFYVDIGANDPIIDSVTAAFYKRGWHGINIEPLPSCFAKLVTERPRDQNYNCAISKQTGTIKFYDVAGLSTLSEDIVKDYKAKKISVKKMRVTTFPLQTLLESCLSQDIHFLKIDVEGCEKEVLESIDLGKTRPWIILVEATLPLTQIQTQAEWEYILDEAKYSCAYFDGLNRYYVAREKQELLTFFKTPVNVFDDVVPYKYLQIQNQLTEALRKLEDYNARLDSLAKFIGEGAGFPKIDLKAPESLDILKKYARLRLTYIRSKEQECAGLMAQIDSLIKNAAVYSKNASAEMQRMMGSYEESRKEVSRLHHTVEQKSKELSILEKQIIEKTAKIESLTGQGIEYFKSIQEIKSNEARLIDELKILQGRNLEIGNQYVSRISRIEGEKKGILEKFHKQTDIFSQGLMDLSMELIQLRRNVADANAAIEGKNQLISNLEHQASRALQRYQESAAALGNLRREMDIRNADLLGGQRELETASSALQAQHKRSGELDNEIKRLRNLIYGASIGQHLYRAWKVLVKDSHYCQKKLTQANVTPTLVVSRSKGNKVPWHTHIYRMFKALFVKSSKPWHTHFYRFIRNILDDPKYRPDRPPKIANADQEKAKIIARLDAVAADALKQKN